LWNLNNVCQDLLSACIVWAEYELCDTLNVSNNISRVEQIKEDNTKKNIKRNQEKARKDKRWRKRKGNLEEKK
jgi:hypothetical protein